ncbi:MAG: SRPBCC family protein [Bacteriovoracaceae bacterium]
MKKNLIRIAISLAVIIAVLLLFATTKPDTFRVERTMSIKAAPEKVYALINDFHEWKSWSPFEKLDTTMNKTFSGAMNGKGAVYEWSGNSNAGSGRMEITDTVQYSKITIKLDFITPFEGHNTAEFILQSDGENTKVTWAMYGPNLYLGKVMSIFFSMDAMLGSEFNKGLADIKLLSEQ